jgi:hypothetical protein
MVDLITHLAFFEDRHPDEIIDEIRGGGVGARPNGRRGALVILAMRKWRGSEATPRPGGGAAAVPGAGDVFPRPSEGEN